MQGVSVVLAGKVAWGLGPANLKITPSCRKMPILQGIACNLSSFVNFFTPAFPIF